MEINEKSESGASFVDITSDTQYQIEDVSFAEGNVILNFGNALLYADKVSYDSTNKIFIAKF